MVDTPLKTYIIMVYVAGGDPEWCLKELGHIKEEKAGLILLQVYHEFTFSGKTHDY